MTHHPCIVEVTVMGRLGEASAALLKYQIEEYLRKARRFPPDSRFDWSTARCEVVEIERVGTPLP